MPSIKDESTVEAIAREFTSNGRNKERALKAIGYAESSCKSGKAVKDVFGNLRVKSAIARIDTRNMEEQDVTRETIADMYRNGFNVADKQKNSTGMATNATGLARVYGLLQDNINTTTDSPVILTAEHAERYSLMAAAANRDRIKISKEAV